VINPCFSPVTDIYAGVAITLSLGSIG